MGGTEQEAGGERRRTSLGPPRRGRLFAVAVCKWIRLNGNRDGTHMSDELSDPPRSGNGFRAGAGLWKSSVNLRRGEMTYYAETLGEQLRPRSGVEAHC